MTIENNLMGGGLIPPKKEDKKFSFGAILGYPPISELPESFLLEPLRILNQYSSDMCVAFSIVGAREHQEKKELSPEYLFKNIKKLQGDWRSWGADPKTGAKALMEGLIDKPENPFPLENFDRDWIANWGNWTQNIDALADVKTENYFWIGETSGNMFDNIRQAIWKFRDEKRAVVVGAIWKNEWTYAPLGKIPSKYNSDGFGHAFLVVGWTKDELILQLSNGTGIGDKGLFYMSKEVVNKETLFALMFKDIEESKESILERSEKYRSKKNFFTRFAAIFRSGWIKIRIFFNPDYIRTLGALRSPGWNKVRNQFLKDNPNCAVCGKKSTLLKSNEVHHCVPVHVDKSKELLENNFIVLCREHHYEWGHYYKWSSWNKSVREDAAEWYQRVLKRP